MADPSIISRLADRVRTERERQGLSQAQLAAKAGLSRSQVLAIERGERASTIVTVQTVATALGVPVAELLSATPIGNPPRDTPSQMAAMIRRLPPEVAAALEMIVAALADGGGRRRRAK